MNKKVFLLLFSVSIIILCFCGCKSKENTADAESYINSQNNYDSEVTSDLKSQNPIDKGYDISSQNQGGANSNNIYNTYSDGNGLTISIGENKSSVQNHTSSDIPQNSNSDNSSGTMYSNYMDKDGNGFIDGNY